MRLPLTVVLQRWVFGQAEQGWLQGLLPQPVLPPVAEHSASGWAIASEQ